MPTDKGSALAGRDWLPALLRQICDYAVVSDSVQEALETLGLRLREIRRDAGISGRELAAREGWHESKVSRIEHGKARPSSHDIRAYCHHTRTDHQLDDLLATLHNIDAAYIEWRRLLAFGVERAQRRVMKNEATAHVIRNYEPQIIPGLLQTAEYSAAKLRGVIEFYQLVDDLDKGVTRRMQRQRILYEHTRKFHFLVGEKALYSTVGSDVVMIGQLDRLSSILGMPRITVGIIPLVAEVGVAIENFVMFDNRMVKVECHTAELTITQPREIKLYHKAFDTLAKQSVTGDAARALIRKALDLRHSA